MQSLNRESAFDDECLKFCGAKSLALEVVAEGSRNTDFLNPSSMYLTSSVQTPKNFTSIMKQYQLKGLQWFLNCYEQGLNGIVVDEVGLGKTIQAMEFLTHLVEENNIWGPFLVVAPD